MQSQPPSFDSKLAAKRKAITILTNILPELRTKAKNQQTTDYLSKVFSVSQIQILSGKKKVQWSDDDMAKAFTLRHIGGKRLYCYLRHTLNYPLPSLSAVQKWAANTNEEIFSETDRTHRELLLEYRQLRIRCYDLAKQKKILRKVFSESQVKLLTGRKRICWSEDDMVVCHSILCLGNRRSYDYLTKELKIPLPIRYTVRRWLVAKQIK